jgi:hypothetical protein
VAVPAIIPIRWEYKPRMAASLGCKAITRGQSGPGREFRMTIPENTP